ncbi:prolyl oligopeptidase family protein [Wolffia australiana]
MQTTSSEAAELEERKQKKVRRTNGEMPARDEINGLDDFPVEEIVQHPLPGYAAPSSISFSPDDGLITYLFSPDNSLRRNIYAFDLLSGRHELVFGPPGGGGLDEGNLSEEEKLRRERARERGLGVTRYEWRAKTASEKPGIIVPLPAGVFLHEIGSSESEIKLPAGPSSPIIDPHLSPDGNLLAFVQDDELHVYGLLSGEQKQLTFGARGNAKTHGLAEYIAQEEMDRKTGFWWSPDSKLIAFTEVDSSKVPLFRIMHQGKPSLGGAAEEDHAYPFAGSSNVTVRLGIVAAAGGQVTWMDLTCGEDPEEEYLARVNWAPDGGLLAQVLNRAHTQLKLLRFDPGTGQREEVLVEQNETWVNLHDCFTPLEWGRENRAGGFIWASEKTGFRHLYLHDRSGACLGPLTEGDWMVEQVAGVNDKAGIVYFTGTADGPLESHLYCAELFPDWALPLPAPRRLTPGKGRHAVVLDHGMQQFVDVHDSIDSPPAVALRSLSDGTVITTLYEQPPASSQRFQPPEIIRVNGDLYGALYRPDAERFGPPPYKTVVSVYGGPCVQTVSDSWISTVDMRAQFFRSKGFLVWKMDNRGTARRGMKFEGEGKYRLGVVDAEDQRAGVEWLVRLGLARPGEVGIYGWSYGGYLAAMTVARFPETFRCAVAGAPVTAWDGYDTFYTEKYMGLPKEKEREYRESSVMAHVGLLQGKLMLVHGMIDENVHFRHTARLVNALISAGKPYELLLFPDERHMPRRLTDRIYMEQRIWDFFRHNL